MTPSEAREYILIGTVAVLAIAGAVLLIVIREAHVP